MKTMKFLLAFIVIGLMTSSNSFGQKIDGTEVGFDGYFGASTNGGSFTIGGKYGLKFGEYFITGPSLRYQRSWTNNANTGQKSSFNVFGGGVFGHARFFNALFVGAEFEMLKTPLNDFGQITSTKNWVPTLFIGGGYSQEFNEKFRINAGIMYDVINSPESPLRAGYFMRNSQQKLLPLIYRLALFIPIS
ncbi:MAG: hypothetical protein ACI837_002387 [Crocinitomicaceae bacterium]|jgi:hypothetical protein